MAAQEESTNAPAATADDATSNEPKTRCQGRGKEITQPIIPMKEGDRARFLYVICKTPAAVRITLDDELLVDQQTPPPDEIDLELPAQLLGRGVHVLLWSFLGAGPEWQTLAELSVKDVVRFRHFKSHKGNDPVNRGFLLLEVQ